MKENNKKLLDFSQRMVVRLFALETIKEENTSKKIYAFGSGFVYKCEFGTYVITTSHLLFDQNCDGGTLTELDSAVESKYTLSIDTNIIQDEKIECIEIENKEIHSIFLFESLANDIDDIPFFKYDMIFAKFLDTDISYKCVSFNDFEEKCNGIIKFTDTMIDKFEFNHHYYKYFVKINDYIRHT